MMITERQYNLIKKEARLFMSRYDNQTVREIKIGNKFQIENKMKEKWDIQY